MKFEEWIKGIENAAIKGLCSTHPNICKMIYNEGQKDIEKTLKDKGVCLQSEYDELQKKYDELSKAVFQLKGEFMAVPLDDMEAVGELIDRFNNL